MEFKYKIENNGITITGHTDKSVKSINIPEFIDNLPVTNIGGFSFCGYTSLTRITIPNRVSIIGNAVFSHCKSLNHINIPNSITNIGINAFMGCNSIKEINSVKLKEGINLIYNRFIYYKQMVYKIQYGIDSDYYCENKNIFINGKYVKL